jgi:SAM-dependent methyltransferase
MNTHWSERFFGPLYMRFDEMRNSNLLEEIRGIIHLCNISRQSRVTELCCGYGRLLIPLVAKTGVKAIGIDKASSLIVAARESAREQGLSIIWKEADLVNYRCKKSFDVAYIAGNSFGYYNEMEKNERVLVAARSMLKKGGVFLLGQWNCPKNFHGASEDGEFSYERRTKYDSVANVYSGVYSYCEKATKRTFNFPFHCILYRRSQLVKMLANCGFDHFQFYGGFDGRPFAETGKRLVILCRAV